MRYSLPQSSTHWTIRETLAPTTPRRRRRGPDPARRPARSGPSGEMPPTSRPEAVQHTAPGATSEPGTGSVHSLGTLPLADPFQDADALEDLGDEIATLAAHIHAATHRLLLLIAEFDRREGWKLGGHRSCAYWLSYRTGIDLGAAREKVRTARALVDLPLIGASMARGELSFSKVRALSRVATADNEADLLPCARGATTAQVERMVRGYRMGDRRDEVERARERHRNRSFSVFPDVDGMYVVRGRLTPELGALLMRAVEAASHALYREERRDGAGMEDESAAEIQGGSPGGVQGPGGIQGQGSPIRDPSTGRARDTEREAAQRRADALGLLAERALGAGFGDDEGNGVPVSGNRAERYQVVVHVDAETLKEKKEEAWEDGKAWKYGGAGETGEAGEAVDGCGRPAGECGCGAGPRDCGRSELDDGTRVSPETSRRIACDAGRVEMRHGPGGSILDVGRRTRTVPPALRRALEARDQGCRFPGCGLRFAEGHHVTHWADGGETKLENLVLLCRHHHRLLHEEGWSMQWWGQGRPVFFDPRGGIHFDGRWTWPGAEEVDGAMGEEDLRKAGGSVVASAPALAADLIANNEARGIQPHGRTASARWKTENHIPDSIYFTALEAMGEAGG